MQGGAGPIPPRVCATKPASAFFLPLRYPTLPAMLSAILGRSLVTDKFLRIAARTSDFSILLLPGA